MTAKRKKARGNQASLLYQNFHARLLVALSPATAVMRCPRGPKRGRMRLTVAGEIGRRQPTAPPDSSMIARIPSAAAFRSAPHAASTMCQAPRCPPPA